MSRDVTVLNLPLDRVAALDASAGTGKTYSIALIYVRLVLAGVPVEEILVTTFTEDAAAELRERLRQRLVDARTVLAGGESGDKDLPAVIQEAQRLTEKPDRLRELVDSALSRFDLAPVCTIHGFCNRLLREHALELGVNPQRDLLAQDPRIGRLAGDYLARLARDREMDAGTQKSLASQIQQLAAKIREYDLPGPDPVSVDTLRQRARDQWRDQARPVLAAAQTAWLAQKEAIEAGLKRLVISGAIAPAEYSNPKAAGDKQKWTLVRNSVAAVDKLLGDVEALLADMEAKPRWAFGEGAARLRASQIIKLATSAAGGEVKSFVAGHSFLALWDEVRDLPKPFSKDLNAVELRGLAHDFLRQVAELEPGRDRQYSDLINAVYARLDDPGFSQAVRAAFRAVLVDECQDTDPRQIAIFHRLFAQGAWLQAGAARCLVWVGDPKQSIYRFRGVDIETYLQAKRQDVQTLSLGVNYRSDPPVVAAVNALFQGPGPRAPAVFHEAIPFQPVVASQAGRLRVRNSGQIPPAFYLHTWAAPEEAPSKTALLRPVLEDCARQIDHLLQSGLEVQEKGAWHPLRAGHIAVLARKHRELESVRRALLRRGIPCVYQTDRSVYLEDEARDLALLFQALASPRPAHLRAVLATPLFGYTLPEVVGLTDLQLNQHQMQLSGWAERIKREGVVSVLFSLLRTSLDPGGRDPPLVRLAAQLDGERVLTNLLQLGELLQAAWIGSHARSAAALKDFLDLAMARAQEAGKDDPDEETRIRLETDAPAVVLATIHAAKGLEYPVVFLPTIWLEPAKITPPGVLVHAADGSCRLVLPADPDWPRVRATELASLRAEQMRLLYVALTRARHQIHAWWGRSQDSSWNVSSTRTAFGRLLWENPLAAESYKDEECVQAFEAAMQRDSGATYHILDMRAAGAAGFPWPAPAPDASHDPAAPRDLSPAGWTRRGALSAAPLQSSYTSLVRAGQPALPGDDEIPAPPTDEVSDGRQLAPDAGGVVDDVLAPLKAGAVLGDRIHGAMESAMAATTPANAEARFVEALVPELPWLMAQPPPEPPDYAAMAAAIWRRTAAARIGGPGQCLAAALAQPHVPEWEFLLPQHAGLTPKSLAEALAVHGQGSPWGGGYNKLVQNLGFRPLQGYFEGLVDLLARLPDGRWILVDYKTNRLDAYTPDHLQRAMVDHHYLLQALLYSVAAARWLRQGVAGWNYNEHFAGAAFLFLRGLANETSQGVWMARPPEPLVMAVGNLLCARSGMP